MTNAETAIAPVHKTLVVSVGPERAFEVFTREIGTWWPLDKYSIGETGIVEVIFEEHVGGRVFERHADGSEADWGKVLSWDPPGSFSMSWSPGSDPAKATELSVRFAAEGEGTRVDLEHRGWEILAERGHEARNSYGGGWESVLGYYTRHLNA
jgi:Activator of Hsp90 ATPase homolog 1-like protein